MAPTSAFTFPDLAVHHADLGVRDGDLAAHDAPISAFTFPRRVQGWRTSYLPKGAKLNDMPSAIAAYERALK